MAGSAARNTPGLPFDLDEAARIVALRRSFESLGDREEILSEALFRFWRVLQEGRKIERPRAYFSRIVDRVAIDLLRARTRYTESRALDEFPAAAEQSSTEELLSACAKHLDELSIEILRLTVFEDRSAVEAARELLCHPVTIRKKRQRALKRLRFSGFVSELQSV